MVLFRIEPFNKFGDNLGGFYLSAKDEKEAREIMQKKVIECNLAGYSIKPTEIGKN